ncbi:MAG: hypothetical protein ACI32F_06995 [Allobaculum sp.]
MKSLTNQQIKNQFALQTTLYNRLKKWLQVAMVLSSFFISIAVFLKQEPVIFWPACILLACTMIAMVIIGLALKRGKDNLDKLLILLDQQIEQA